MTIRENQAVTPGELRLAALLDNLREGAALFDRQGRCRYANPALIRLGGVSAEPVGHSLTELLPWLSSGALADLRQALAQPSALTLVQHDQTRDLWVELRAVPGEDGLALYLRDITEEHRERMSAALAAERSAQLRQIIALLSDALTPDEVARVIVGRGISALGAQAGIVSLLAPQGEQLELVAAQGYPPDIIERYRRLLLEPGLPLTDALLLRTPLLIESRTAALQRYPALADDHQRGSLHAWANMPLLLDERPIGVLEISFDTPRLFDEADRTFLMTLAQQCAQAIDRARLYERAQRARARAERAADQAQRLQHVTAVLSEALTPAQVAEVIIRQGLDAVGAYAGVLILRVPGGEHFTVLASIGYPTGVMNQWKRVPLDAPVPLAETARSGEAIWLASPEVYAQRYPGLALTLTETAALTALPLSVRGRVIGALGLSFREPQPFPPEDRAYMLTLAHQCALALERARLFNEAQLARVRAERAADRTERLQQVTAALSEALTPAQVGAVVVYQALHAMGAQRGYVSLLTPDRTRLELLHQIGYSHDYIAQTWPVEMDRSLPMTDVVRSAEPMFVETTEELPSAYRGEGSWTRLSSSAALMPLLIEGHAIGGMSLGFQIGRSFSPEDQAFLLALAQQCAQALERARLYDEERAARAEAETALGVRDTFFSVAAHELKTPLTSLLGQAQLFQRRAKREGTLGERDLRSLDVLIDQALRLNKMVTALLDISRIDQGQLSIEPQPLDLVALTRRVLDEILPMLHRHTIVAELPELPLMVAGDSLRLEQVLQNLIGNAVKYMPLGGAVVVRAGSRGGRAWVAVADEGIGIPADALPHLFTRFYRAANSYPMHISGMGIGLYVVREIVTLHGGEVVAESVEGQGSTFTVMLPLLAESESLRAAAQKPLREGAG